MTKSEDSPFYLATVIPGLSTRCFRNNCNDKLLKPLSVKKTSQKYKELLPIHSRFSESWLFRNTEKAPRLKGNYGKNVCLYKGFWPQKDASNWAEVVNKAGKASEEHTDMEADSKQQSCLSFALSTVETQ